MAIQSAPQAKLLRFVDDVDKATDEAMIEEMYWSMIQRHTLYVIDQTESGAEPNLYGEPSEDPEQGAMSPDYDAGHTFPMQIKLDPEEEELNKYGYDRTRDAIIWMSTKILRDLGISPKVGDRIDFTFITELGATVVEHLEITDASAWDFARQAGAPYQVTYSAVRTHKAKQP